MFGLGGGEIAFIILVIIVAVGPDRMPTFVKAVGRGIREFRKATRELRHQVGIDEMMRDDFRRDPLGIGKDPLGIGKIQKDIKRNIEKDLLSELPDEELITKDELLGKTKAKKTSEETPSLIPKPATGTEPFERAPRVESEATSTEEAQTESPNDEETT